MIGLKWHHRRSERHGEGETTTRLMWDGNHRRWRRAPLHAAGGVALLCVFRGRRFLVFLVLLPLPDLAVLLRPGGSILLGFRLPGVQQLGRLAGLSDGDLHTRLQVIER